MEPCTTAPTENNSLCISNPEEFQNHLNEAGDRLVVIHFHSEQSYPSKEMIPKLKALAEHYQDVLFITVDTEHEELAERYNVSMTPTFIFIKAGNEIETITGANEQRLENVILNTRIRISTEVEDHM